MADAWHPQTLLAYGMNGGELPTPHGAPVRLRVARQLGYKSLKLPLADHGRRFAERHRTADWDRYRRSLAIPGTGNLGRPEGRPHYDRESSATSGYLVPARLEERDEPGDLLHVTSASPETAARRRTASTLVVPAL